MASLPEFFGIDLGHNSIKVTQVDKNKIVALGEQITQEGLLENESDIGLANLANEVLKAVKNANIRTRNCVVSVPESSIFSRLLTLPKVEGDPSEAIHWALKPLIPVPIENVNISFLEIDEKVKAGTAMVDWYVVAAPKQLVEKVKTITEKANLSLLAVDTESLAVSRLVYNVYKDDKDTLIVDLGAESTNIILARKGIVVFSQTLSNGSNALSKIIAADYGIDVVEAEKYKRSFGIDYTKGDGKIAKSIEPVLDILANEINRLFIYFKEKVEGANISNIVLCGGGSNLPGLDSYIFSKFNIETKVLKPMEKLGIDKSIKNIKDLNIQSFAVPIGLAMKEY